MRSQTPQDGRTYLRSVATRHVLFRRPESAVHIHVIDTIQAFAESRDAWERVYDSDPDAQFFLSWSWLAQWLPMLRNQWLVLAARPSDSEPCVAFFPLRVSLKEGKDGYLFNELNMAGNYLADYTGFICSPGYDHRAIPAFAAHIRKLHWTRLHLENIRTTEARLRLFLEGFPASRFRIRAEERIIKPENVDNCACAAVRLPDDWDVYLRRLSANTRQKLRRLLRQVDTSDDLRITRSDAVSVGRDLNILLDFWARKWGHRKGDRLGALLKSGSQMLKRNCDIGNLLLLILWRKDVPMGAVASFIDTRKKSLLFYMGGRDESFDNPPPGLVLHAYSIRHAIQNGYKTYDFLRGNEPYKYSFGGDERRIACMLIDNRDRGGIEDKLELKTVPDALRRATQMHQSGRLVPAERAYRQILATDPACSDALYCLGQLKAAADKHAAAIELFRALVAIKPDSEKGWLRLARSLESSQRLAEAADAYREAARLAPDLAIAQNRLRAIESMALS